MAFVTYTVAPCAGGATINIDFSGTSLPAVGGNYYLNFTGSTTDGCYEIIDTSESGIDAVLTLGTNWGSCEVCLENPPASPTPTKTPTSSITSTPGQTSSPTPTNTVTPTITPTQRNSSLADVLCNCSGNTNRNIYVFYDGSGSYEDSLLQDVSLSVRMWYSGLTTNSGWTGNLYEMVIWDERWISWPIYPIIGTLSGATIDGNYINNGSLLYSGITNDTATKQAMKEGAAEDDFPITTDTLAGRLPGGKANSFKSYKVRLKSLDKEDSNMKTPEVDKPEVTPSVKSIKSEAIETKPPFEGPYTKVKADIKDKSGAVHSPMSRAKNLAQQAFKKVQDKTKVKSEMMLGKDGGTSESKKW
jgi:hypothetical protein